ncbi:MAG: CCA tRNA nucleotidyltransferase [Muribaculaceae bacterium]|nr:CCA tRNA nucleotidyltransferase [Muribaculaceae bacterium]
MNLADRLKDPVFATIAAAADEAGLPAYAVGGYVRDLIIGRHSKDIDFVAVGSGIDLAHAVARRLGRRTRVNVFRTYGTAQIRRGALELEFVGARRESYTRDSRNPVVESGTLEEDIARRDFTINAMAISVNGATFGELVDLYGGLDDIRTRTIRTPLDPDVTFSDDPLRMMRAVRFASQLQFDIEPATFEAICRNAARIEIITVERIKDELCKIMRSPRPSVGLDLLHRSGLLRLIFPELEALAGVEIVHGRGHKDNFYHTLQVLDTVAAASDNEWLRWGALLHDIGKPSTKRFDDRSGWTFHNHNFVGAKMVPRIFSRLRLGMGAEMRYVQKLVELHMRPIALVEDEVTDSAVRRLVNYAEDDLADLMILARADITSKNEEKKQRFLENFDIVERKYEYIRTLDAERARRNPVDGHEIMHIFGLPPSPPVGMLASALKQAIKDCEIDDTRQAALDFLVALAAERGIAVVNPPDASEPTD